MMQKIAWWVLVQVLRFWCNRYIDKWERVCLITEYGPVFLSIDRETPWPESFDHIV